MSKTTLIYLLFVCAFFAGQYFKNTKFMKTVRPYRGFIFIGTGTILISYNLILFKSIIKVPVVPFMSFPLIFIVLGLFMLHYDTKRKVK